MSTNNRKIILKGEKEILIKNKNTIIIKWIKNII